MSPLNITTKMKATSQHTCSGCGEKPSAYAGGCPIVKAVEVMSIGIERERTGS